MQGISNPFAASFFEYRRLPFTFISTLPLSSLRKCIWFDTYLRTLPTVFPLLSLHAIATYHVREKTFRLYYRRSNAKSLEKSEIHGRKIDFKCFYDNRGISSSTFSVIILIDGSMLYVLFRVFITVRCWLKHVCM